MDFAAPPDDARFAAAHHRLNALLQQHLGRRSTAVWYLYRSGEGNAPPLDAPLDGGTLTGVSGRPRRVLVFANPDSAMLFAQRNALGTVRLHAVLPHHLLPMLYRTPTIDRLIFVREPLPATAPGTVPVGWHLTRADLHALVQRDPAPTNNVKGATRYGEPL